MSGRAVGIVLDTSAVMAVLLGEAGAGELADTMAATPCLMSAATRVELGIVVEARTGPAGTLLMEELLNRLEVEVVALDGEQTAEALVCWRRFGKGRHPAGLNLGDTFSYALARRAGEPLLFVGEDFAKTDVPIS